MSRVFVSILCHNRLELTKACLAAALANNSVGAKIVVTDNASTDGTLEWLKSTPGIEVLSRTANDGFIQPNNDAYAMAKEEGFEFFVMLNNDTVVPAGWLEKLLLPFRDNPSMAITGAHGGCSELDGNGRGKTGRLDYVEGACMCVRVAHVENPLFSDYLTFAYCEDADLSLRVRERGLQIALVNLDIQHGRGKTSEGNAALKEKCDRAYRRNHYVLKARWKDYLESGGFKK